MQYLDVGQIGGPARPLRFHEIGPRQERDPHAVNVTNDAVGPRAIERHRQGNRKHIDTGIVPDDGDRLTRHLTCIEFGGHSPRQPGQSLEKTRHVAFVLRHQEIDVLGGPHRAVQVRGYAPGNEVAHPRPVEQPADPKQAIIGTTGSSGHGANAGTDRRNRSCVRTDGSGTA